MELSFDMRGYLKPSGKNPMSFEAFEALFVKPFEETSSRKSIFEDYRKFLLDFRAQVTTNFTQWINGSFVSNKENPADIDFVTLIDLDVYQRHETTIDRNFRLHWAKAKYPKVDAYTLKILPSDHENFRFLRYDLQYWEEWFGNSRPNRANRTFEKGFVEIHFNAITNIE